MTIGSSCDLLGLDRSRVSFMVAKLSGCRAFASMPFSGPLRFDEALSKGFLWLYRCSPIHQQYTDSRKSLIISEKSGQV